MKTILILFRPSVIIEPYLEPFFYVKVSALAELSINNVIYSKMIQKFSYPKINSNLSFIETLKTLRPL